MADYSWLLWMAVSGFVCLAVEIAVEYLKR